MRVGVWMPLYGRHKVLKATLTAFREMQVRWRAEGIELFLNVAWSNPEDLFAAADNYGPLNSIFYPNDPLSEKQEALIASMRMKFDYYLQIGSDDVFLEHGDKYYFDAIDKGVDYIGCRSVYFIEPSSKRAVSVKQRKDGLNKVFGAGRLWSNEAVEKVLHDGYLWPQKKNNQLDLLSEKQFKANGIKIETFEESYPFVVDVKSDTNIWSFDKYKNETKEDYFAILGGMGEGTSKAVSLSV